MTDRFSGQWRIRFPKSLHAALVLRAKQEGVSLNTLTATLLAQCMGQILLPRQRHVKNFKSFQSNKISSEPINFINRLIFY
ncbi:MAG: toxin-antitoxin system HicB family antitoxin [Gammaproteobacteria bacterium]|nr:toxin-antitoxin system HicB family antitoxin [Gammaproteobacteria bacterium]